MRLIFEKFENFKEWLVSIGESLPSRYVAFVTDENEVIIVPKKSTRPIIYGYLQTSEIEKVMELLNKLGIRVFEVTRVEWDETKPVGIG